MKYEKVILRVHRLRIPLKKIFLSDIYKHHVTRSFIYSLLTAHIFLIFLLSRHFAEVNDGEDPCRVLTKFTFGPRKLYNNTPLPPTGRSCDRSHATSLPTWQTCSFIWCLLFCFSCFPVSKLLTLVMVLPYF